VNLDILLVLSGGLDWCWAAEIDLCSKLSRLFVGSHPSKNGRVTVKMLDNFLKRSVSSLDIELPDYEKFKEKPDIVKDIVLPFKVRQCDRVHILVEEQRKINCQP
jgi:hypothetical protein